MCVAATRRVNLTVIAARVVGWRILAVTHGTVNGRNAGISNLDAGSGADVSRPLVAVLDDYQRVALDLVAWASLPIDLRTFHEHIADVDDLAAQLGQFDIIAAMRERTPFPATLLRRLPRLGLLVTTGPRNAVIDVATASERGVVVCGTESPASPTVELTWVFCSHCSGTSRRRTATSAVAGGSQRWATVSRGLFSGSWAWAESDRVSRGSATPSG